MSEEEMRAAFEHENQRAMQQMRMGAPKSRMLGDEMSLKSQSSFGKAWSFLKQGY